MSNDEESYEVTCIWEMKNFNESCVGVEFWSPVFAFKTLDDTQWRIALCVDNYDDNSRYFFNFRLKYVSEDITINKVDCELSIIDGNGSPLQKTEKKNWDVSNIGCCSLESLKATEDVFGLSKSKFFPRETLTVRCRMRNNSQGGHTEKESHSSRVRIERSCFLWTIENFCQLQPFQKSKMHLVQTDSSTPIFTFELFFDDYERFQMKVTPSSCYAGIDASFKVSVLDVNRRVFKSEDFSLFNSLTSLSLKRREMVDNKNLYVSMGILSLQVECFFVIEGIDENTLQFAFQDLCAIRDTAKDPIITFTSTSENPCQLKDGTIASYEKCNSSYHREFFQNMQRLYKDGLFCDAVLLAGGESFFIHKSILSTRFSAFKTIFTASQEKKRDIIHITDVNGDTLTRMLLFAYSDKLEEDLHWNDAMSLYFAAKTYSIKDLKCASYSILKSSLCASNVCKILAFADSHEDPFLKSVAMDFILSHDDEVIGNEEWDEFQKSHLQLAVEILGELYKKKLQGINTIVQS